METRPCACRQQAALALSLLGELMSGTASRESFQLLTPALGRRKADTVIGISGAIHDGGWMYDYWSVAEVVNVHTIPAFSRLDKD